MIRFFFAVLIAFLPSLAHGSGCYVRRVYAQPIVSYAQAVVQPVVQSYVAPVAVAQYVTVPVQVPAYSAGLAAEDNVTLTEAVQRLTAAVERLQAGGAQNILPLQAEHPAVNLFRTKCASCHDAGVADKKGAGFALLRKGEVVPLDGKELAKVATMTALGHMPKNGKPLTPEELGEIMNWVQEQASDKPKAERAPAPAPAPQPQPQPQP